VADSAGFFSPAAIAFAVAFVAAASALRSKRSAAAFSAAFFVPGLPSWRRPELVPRESEGGRPRFAFVAQTILSVLSVLG